MGAEVQSVLPSTHGSSLGLLCVCVSSSVSRKGTCHGIPVNPGGHRKILNVITSAKTLFPDEVTVPGPGSLDSNAAWGLGPGGAAPFKAVQQRAADPKVDQGNAGGKRKTNPPPESPRGRTKYNATRACQGESVGSPPEPHLVRFRVSEATGGARTPAVPLAERPVFLGVGRKA